MRSVVPLVLKIVDWRKKPLKQHVKIHSFSVIHFRSSMHGELKSSQSVKFIDMKKLENEHYKMKPNPEKS